MEDWVMKAYVVACGQRLEHPLKLIEVAYSADPCADWKYAIREAAEAVCKKLDLFEVRVGRHHCAFSVDPLVNGDFGIFCVCHPRCIRARSSVFSEASRQGGIWN